LPNHGRSTLKFLFTVGLLLASTACGVRSADILLFDGTGTSPNDVRAVERVLQANHLSYATASSRQLNAMAALKLRTYRLLIVPGGNFVDIGNSLTPATTINIRSAVQNGMNYLGLCAGGFFAGNSPYNGLNLTSGVRFGFYAAEANGIRKAAVPIAGPGSTRLDQYWEDGPEFTGWGTVVSRYPNGTPAIVEGTSGNGWVVLTGIHPEAPAAWFHGLTPTPPIPETQVFASKIIQSALARTPLSTR
jgi:glutamine amidotransferase-like uncharacterized protein